VAFKNRFYPHLLQPSIDLWEMYLVDHASEYTSFDYDVKVGDGRDPGKRFSDKIRKMALGLSQRRVDVVGHRSDRRDIIEITPYAGIRAIGQLEVYPLLYQQTFKSPERLQPVLICHDISPDIDEALVRKAIIVHRYPRSSTTSS